MSCPVFSNTMCSTPIGITGTGTRARRHAGSRFRVLNADWHHGDGHALTSRPVAVAGLVLNADWHHGDGHFAFCSAADCFALCSTPIGITGTGTRRSAPLLPRPAGAQRRLASRGRAPAMRSRSRSRLAGAQRRLASRGRALCVPLPLPTRRLVLNADWHHGDGHETGEPRDGVAGIVLNADWHHGDGHWHPALRHARTSHVLNADWHHGDGHIRQGVAAEYLHTCSTPIGITGTGTSSERLGVDSLARCSTPIGITGTGTRRHAPRNAEYLRCSTPIGITGTGTHELPFPRRGHGVLNADWHHGDGHQIIAGLAGLRRRVLNADWHHGDGHSQNWPNWLALLWCSTPIGITGTGTTIPTTRACSSGGAQRRLASRGRAPSNVGLNFRSSLCSTPIGITGTGTPQACGGCRQARGAQRRLASRGRALSRSANSAANSPVLNADWHHGDGHSYRQRAAGRC